MLVNSNHFCNFTEIQLLFFVCADYIFRYSPSMFLSYLGSESGSCFVDEKRSSIVQANNSIYRADHL